jgi:hypothetical protein
MQATPAVTDIAHGIQLAVAPVFLLSGVGVTLTTLTNRMARIIDRARYLENALVEKAPGDEAMHAELGALARRAKLIQLAITLCTVSALLICLVIVGLFAGALVSPNLSWLIVVVFVLAMAAFIGALLTFLFEIRLATASLRFGAGIPKP